MWRAFATGDMLGVVGVVADIVTELVAIISVGSGSWMRMLWVGGQVSALRTPRHHLPGLPVRPDKQRTISRALVSLAEIQWFSISHR